MADSGRFPAEEAVKSRHRHPAEAAALVAILDEKSRKEGGGALLLPASRPSIPIGVDCAKLANPLVERLHWVVKSLITARDPVSHDPQLNCHE